MVSLNGNLTNEISSDFFLKNRAFRLGDGFFETVRAIDGKVFNWPSHYMRIKACAEAMNMDLHPVFSEASVQRSLEQLLKAKQIVAGGRLRITFFREGTGGYSSTSNKLGFIAEASGHHINKFLLNDKGLVVAVCNAYPKPKDRFSSFKYMGNSTSILAAQWAQKMNVDDALIINEQGQIIEATSSNIFVVKNNKLYTPGVKSGCVSGTSRLLVLNAALDMGIPVFEADLTPEFILQSEEVFLTNAISGIRWVGGFSSKRYFHKMSGQILDHINQETAVLS